MTGETSAETTTPSEDTSGDTSNTDETDMNTQEDSETESDIELMSLESGQITVQGITFDPWEKTDTLPDTVGNWYLTGNVELSSEWSAPSGETNLCLNGNNIKISSVEHTLRCISKTTEEID